MADNHRAGVEALALVGAGSQRGGHQHGCQCHKKVFLHTIHYDYVAIHGPYDRRIPMSVYDNNRYYAMSYTISNYKKSPAEKNKSQGIVNLSYIFEYDIHYYPYLLVLVENMISGDRNSFFEIFHPTFKNEYIPIRDEIIRKEKQYMDLDEKNDSDIVSKKIKVLDEIREMLLKVQQGDFEIPVRKYYEEAQQLFTIEEKIVEKESTK